MLREVLGREEYLDRWQELHGGYDPRSSRLVGPWLVTVHALARPFARLGVPPDAVTLLGLVTSGVVVWLAALGGRWVLLAALVVAASGLLDSVDGAVAVLSGRVTRWGAVLDSVVDRLSDLLYVLALWLVGAPPGACLAAAVLLVTHEYTRARATAVGLDDVGIITVAERPTRVIIVAMFLLGAGIYPDAAEAWATAGAMALVVVGAVGLVQLLVVVRRRLR